MKLPFLYALPPLDKSARLPLVLAALLSVAFGYQLWTVDDTPLPPFGPIAGGSEGPATLAEAKRETGGAVILRRSIFTPNVVRGGGGSGANPMGGLSIAGSIQIGGNRFAVVQGPGNRSANVRIGGHVGDWRLRAIRQNDAVLTRAAERIIVPFGGGSTLPMTAEAARSQ